MEIWCLLSGMGEKFNYNLDVNHRAESDKSTWTRQSVLVNENLVFGFIV